jgi:DNA-binding MarR family transcriptional regulator
MPDDDLIRSLERISIHSGTITTRALADVHPELGGLSVSQYRVFALVASTADGIRMSELAELSSTRPQAATRLVQRLEAKGFVRSERRSLDDRRGVVVSTTDQGSRAWAEISARRRGLLAEALAATTMAAEAASVLEDVARALERYARQRRTSFTAARRFRD